MKTQLLIHLPTEVARRFREAVPARQRSSFIADLLEKSLPNTDLQMFELALKAEAFDRAQPEDTIDLEATLMDGLDPNESFDAGKLAALCQP
jgi:hypothetical protein